MIQTCNHESKHGFSSLLGPLGMKWLIRGEFEFLEMGANRGECRE